MSEFKQLINGEMVGSAATFDVINPSTGAVLAAAPHASEEQARNFASHGRAQFSRPHS